MKPTSWMASLDHWRLGDFHLIVAGDGIRSDVQIVAAHVNALGVGLSRLSLLEIQLGQIAKSTLVIPTVPLRTEIIEQRVFITQSGAPLQMEVPTAADVISSMEGVVDPNQGTRRAENRAFWQRFIDGVHFDHPDQAAPRHGGDNWVKIALPEPNRLAYSIPLDGIETRGRPVHQVTRSGRRSSLRGTRRQSWKALRAESGLDLVDKSPRAEPLPDAIGVYRDRLEFASDDEQLAWLN